jgi:hypothetical protein
MAGVMLHVVCPLSLSSSKKWIAVITWYSVTYGGVRRKGLDSSRSDALTGGFTDISAVLFRGRVRYWARSELLGNK